MVTMKSMKAKVLLADDDRLVLSTLADGLGRAGYVTITAASGTEAVRIYAEQSPDIVVLDIRMPGLSGTEAMQKIQERKKIPVLFLSAFDSQDMVREAVAMGALGYLVKPVRINQFVTSIEAALARWAEIVALKNAEENLKTALQGDRNIGIATGLIMERYHLQAIPAFELLRRHVRSRQCKLEEVAAEIVSSAEKLNQVGP